MMKIKSLLFASLFLLATLTLQAQQPATTSKEAYIEQLENLFEEGRYYYAEVGNKAQLTRIVDSCYNVVNRVINEGVFTEEEQLRLLLAIRYYKLAGDYYYLMSDNEKNVAANAEEAFRRALQEANHPAYANQPDIVTYKFVLHEELAQLYYKHQHYADALSEMQAAQSYATNLTGDALLDFLSQQAICEARVGQFPDAVRTINMVVNSYSDKKSDGYSEALRKKAKILMLQQEDGGTGMTDPTGEALRCYKEYFALKKAYTLQRYGEMNAQDREQHWMRIRPFVVDCYRTESADPAFLYDVTLFSKALLLEYAAKGKPEFCTYKQLQRKLKSTDCAIEFVQYEKGGNKYIGALVLHKKGEPRFVRIVDVDELLETALREGGNVNQGITGDSPQWKDFLYNDSSLYTKIWTPELLDAIGKDTRRLFFAPDGPFHILAIEYMIPDAPELTSLKADNLYRLTSTRQLLAKGLKTRGQKTLICGDIDYSQPPTEADAGQTTPFDNDEETFWLIKSATRGARDSEGPWTRLVYTKEEVDSIYSLYGDKRSVFVHGTDASEVRVANLMTQYPIVHLSTHGCFLGRSPLANDLLPANYDASLSHNLIALSGANVSLMSDEYDGTQHDGMLSAREIMQMDYSNIELIVLNACQTGLGYVTDDGVYGLQRGLKNAGVKGMILTLWSVSDPAAAAFMESFYNCLLTEDAHDAFFHTRQEFIDSAGDSSQGSLDAGANFNFPYYYDAFILIDVR